MLLGQPQDYEIRRGKRSILPTWLARCARFAVNTDKSDGPDPLPTTSAWNKLRILNADRTGCRLSRMPFCVTLFTELIFTRNPERLMSSTGPLLHSSVDQGVLVLTIVQARIQGEETAQQLREEMQLAFEKAGINRVVVDLQHVRYLSSVAFWPLLSLRRQLLGIGGRLIICGLSGDIEVLFLTTKMISTGGAVDAPFEVAPDPAAAIARLLA